MVVWFHSIRVEAMDSTIWKIETNEKNIDGLVSDLANFFAILLVSLKSSNSKMLSINFELKSSGFIIFIFS